MTDFGGETLRYGFTETALGTIAAARSDRGVAAIVIGDDRGRLVRDLRALLDGATLIEDEAALADMLAVVAELADHPERKTDLPLDLRGSEQELAVWDALTRIPAGATTTYGAIAKALPMPATAQEVGQACGANRVAIAIPCHRVVKADGGISGYRWGIERKRRLINLEAVA